MRVCDNEMIRLDYVNGDLGPLRHILFARHLARCPACRQAVEELAEMAAEMRTLPRPVVPPDLVRRTAAAMVSMQSAEGPAPWRAGWFAESWHRLHVVAAHALAAGVICAVVMSISGGLPSLLSETGKVDVMACLFGMHVRPDSANAVPIGALVLIAALLSIPSLFDNVVGLALHHALAGSGRRRNRNATRCVHMLL